MRSSSWVFALLLAACLWTSLGKLLADDGKKTRDSAKSARPTEPVGCPLAPGMIALLEDEIKTGLKQRRIEPGFAQFVSYAARNLDTTADRRSWSEVAGNCRLSWYDKLYRNPLKATAEAEQFTRKLHQAVLANCSGLGRVLDMAAKKLDWVAPKAAAIGQIGSPEDIFCALAS
jgi:hypothetical protein